MKENLAFDRKKLKELAYTLEDCFNDMCGFEFTIEKGQIYILDVTVNSSRRLDIVNVRCALDFFSKGKIDLNEALSRISPQNVLGSLSPEISNIGELKVIGNGLPASSGIATGIVLYEGNEFSDLIKNNDSYILVKNEFSHEDIELLMRNNVKGILSIRGGMTSHAACISRGIAKPCICDCENITIENKSVISKSAIAQNGEYITIDGDSGKVYLGKGNITKINWKEKEEIVTLVKMIEHAIRSNRLASENMGHCWRIRDYFLHNMPMMTSETSKKPVKNLNNYISFMQPDEVTINQYREGILKLSDTDLHNYQNILIGTYKTLSRIISNNVGIGNHNKFFRPILDPMKTISQDEFRQLIAVEFFDISKYVPFLIDVFNIKLFFEIEAYNENQLWFIDNTNLKGESIVDRTENIVSYKILVNDAEVSHEDLPLFYNLIRKREYFWNWYKNNKTSYKEILTFMKMNKSERSSNYELCIKANELGLMDGNNITEAGNHLIK